MAAVRYSLGFLLVASIFVMSLSQPDVKEELKKLKCSPMKREKAVAFIRHYVPKQVDQLVSDKMSEDMVNLVRCHIQEKCAKRGLFSVSFKNGLSECLRVLAQDFGRKMLMDMEFPSY